MLKRWGADGHAIIAEKKQGMLIIISVFIFLIGTISASIAAKLRDKNYSNSNTVAIIILTYAANQV